MGAGASLDNKSNTHEIATSSRETSFCNACQVIDNVTSVAVYYCEDCRHELCNDCYGHHRKTLGTRKHKVTKLQYIKGKDLQVSGRRPNEGATNAPSDEGAARVKKGTGEGKSTDITRKVQHKSISARLQSKPTTDRAGTVYKTATLKKGLNVALSPRLDSKPTTDRAGKVYKTTTLKKGLNVSLESDVGMCDMRGIVLLQDRLIVSDRANSKVKVFGSDHTFQFEYTCNEAPFDIDTLDTTTVVVAYANSGNMKVLSVGSDSMTELVNVNTKYSCIGVCCHDGKIYCVVRYKTGSIWHSEVRVYSPDGTLKRKFDYLSDGKVDCNDLQYITVNPQTGILYVTDFDKGVLALSTNGDVIAFISPPQLKNPLGIAVDDHGQIYVCDVNSHNVIRMSADGGDAEEILSNHPFCQCVKIYGIKMYITRRESGTVFVYELS